MNEVSIIGAVVIGILAGWIAEQVMGREHGLITNLIVGIVGAFLGAFIASVLNIGFAGFWGSLLVGLVLWGPGRWSLDRFVAPRLSARTPYTRAA